MENNNHPGSENLIPFNERSEDEARELGRKGGIASGEARREKRKLCDALKAVVSDEKVQDNLAKALVNKALKGDTKAWETIRDSIGEKPTEKVEADIKRTIILDDF